MTETRIWCDACGELVTSDRTTLRITSSPLRRRTGLEAIDICGGCLPKLEAILAHRPVSTVEHVGGQPEKPKRQLPILVANGH